MYPYANMRFFYFITTLYLLALFGFFTQKKHRIDDLIHINNTLPDPLLINPFHGTDDLGSFNISSGTSRYWAVLELPFFRPSPYYCHFYWAEKHSFFEVYNIKWSGDCVNKKTRTKDNHCRWQVREDGFYFLNYTRSGELLEKKYDWNENYDRLNEALGGTDHSWTALTLKLCNALETANKLVESTNSQVALLSEKIGNLEKIIKRGDRAVEEAKFIHNSPNLNYQSLTSRHSTPPA